MNTPKPGDRIRLVHMPDDPDPIEAGAMGTVRLSQVLALLYLAPEIQEAILFLPPTERGRDPVRERHLRPIAAVADWGKQRGMWNSL